MRIPTKLGNHKPNISFDEAIERTYEIKANRNFKNNSISGTCSFPSILIGHKVKLILIK